MWQKPKEQDFLVCELVQEIINAFKSSKFVAKKYFPVPQILKLKNEINWFYIFRTFKVW
jgi:hypothetical protein